MFFSQDDLAIEILGVYKDERGHYQRKSFERRHSSLGIRLYGKAKFECGEKSYSADEESLIYIPAKVKYSQRSDGECIISVWFINYGADSGEIEIIKPENMDKVRAVFEDVYAVWSEKRCGYKNYCASALYKLFYDLCLSHSENIGSENSLYQKIFPGVSYIHENFRTSDISVAHLAKISYLSETYFRKIFSRIYGITPNKYIRNLRLEWALALLDTGELSIAEVAMRSGFSDSKYFSREFKKRYLKSPCAYTRGRAIRYKHKTGDPI